MLYLLPWGLKVTAGTRQFACKDNRMDLSHCRIAAQHREDHPSQMLLTFLTKRVYTIG